jgi:hypothetical protein
MVEFKHTFKELYPIWYTPDNQFKLRPFRGYPTTALRKPYLYIVAMLCRLYGDSYASKFPLSYIPLSYYCAKKGSSFNWDGILLENLVEAIIAVVEALSGTFLSFHMSSYLIYIMCVSHQYPNMGWAS